MCLTLSRPWGGAHSAPHLLDGALLQIGILNQPVVFVLLVSILDLPKLSYERKKGTTCHEQSLIIHKACVTLLDPMFVIGPNRKKLKTRGLCILTVCTRTAQVRSKVFVEEWRTEVKSS